MGTIVKVAAAVLGGLAVVAGGWLLGMRRKGSPVVTLQRRINHRLFNPRQLRTAGTPGAYASVVQHVGRRSGRQYRTPVGAVPTDDGFLVALVYGEQCDWVQNVLEAGSAWLTHEGAEHLVVPELVDLADVADQLPADQLPMMRAFRVTRCLRLRPAPDF